MRGKLRLLAVAVGIVLLLAAPATAETAHHDDLVRLGKMMGGDKTTDFMMQSLQQQLTMVASMAAPDKRQGISTVIKEELDRERTWFLGEVESLVADIWGQFLTQAEVLELIEIYQQPVMTKTVRLLPAVMQESQVLGTKLGKTMIKRMMPRIEARLKNEYGIDLK